MTSVRAGDTLDSYHIERLVARSGMGSVFKGTDTRDGKPVAIKIPHLELEGDIQFWERFEREAKIGLAAEHPGVMTVYQAPQPGKFYMVLEWLEGQLLRNVLNAAQDKKLSQDRAIGLASRILDALEYLHGRGVTHRDLKPENIMVGEGDGIKIMDFGIGSLEGSRRLTYTGVTGIMGSPDYISPEQVKGKRGDKRSDLYSTGVILYEMLTGKTPFSGPNALAIMNARLIAGPTPPREIEPAISPQLQEIIYRALEREPEERYQTAREFAEALLDPAKVKPRDRTAMASPQIRRTPLSRQILNYVLLGLIPLAILGLLFWIAKR